MSVIAAFMVPHPPLIVSEIGRGRERQVAATIAAYEHTAELISELRPETVIISSPHAVMYRDWFHISPGRRAKGSFADFGAPSVRFEEEYDTELVGRIEELCRREGIPAGTMGELDPALDHGTMVPLYFIRKRYTGGRIVRLGLSGLPLKAHYALGKVIQQAAAETQRRCVFVASGDLSHKLQDYGPYGFAPEGPEYDRRIMDVCSRGAFEELLDFDEGFCREAAECGHRSFVIMSGALDGMNIKAEQLSHEDVTGVGYGICTFLPAEDAYVSLARRTIETYVREGKIISVPKDTPEQLRRTRAGAFVSIHKNGSLRGCIGTILPTRDDLAQEIISNAVSASTRDPRFPAVTADELGELEINVDVLSEPEEIASPDELDVKRYGVIVSCGRRRGLLLPDLEGVDTVEQQIAIAMMKGGISQGERITLHRFEVIRHKQVR